MAGVGATVSPPSTPTSLVIPKGRPLLDSQTKERVEKMTRGFSEYFHLMANEPSLGLFHVQEHVRKTVPNLVGVQRELKNSTQRVDEVKYDTAYSLRTVQGLHGLTTFTSIKDMMINSINMVKEMSSNQPPSRTTSFVSNPRSPLLDKRPISTPTSPQSNRPSAPTSPAPTQLDSTQQKAPSSNEDATTTTTTTPEEDSDKTEPAGSLSAARNLFPSNEPPTSPPENVKEKKSPSEEPDLRPKAF